MGTRLDEETNIHGVTTGVLTNIFYVQNYGSQELFKAYSELSALRKHNKELQKLLTDGKYYQVPKPEYEKLRRRIASNIQEFWYYMHDQLNRLKSKTTEKNANLTLSVDKIISTAVQYKRSDLSLSNDVEKVNQVDGFNKWRIDEIGNLSRLVQKRFHYLQHPVDCKNAKKLVCNLYYGCGFGCQIHHLISCMMVAYGTQRTLILKSNRWQYHKGGWKAVFMPFGNSCGVNDKKIVKWPGTNTSSIIEIPTNTYIKPRPKFMPLAVPEDLAYRLIAVHGNPSAWWIGQILKLFWKPQNSTLSYIEKKMSELKIENPYVAIHIRRTDKLRREAKFYSVQQYMAKVDEYYNQIDINNNMTKRKVYIATDDFNAIKEAITKYPHYDIIYNPDIPKVPKINPLHTNENIFNVILDIHVLSKSDFIVCTFSSNICRLAYGLMQIDHVDASSKVASLDKMYVYSQQNADVRKAILRHQAQTAKEIDLLSGDTIHISDNHWNGYSTGSNLRTKKRGLFPSFKVEMEPEIVKFPI
ncbi:hypothetical protein FQR65_LT10853 [Abscondita terminalis]|nr:hypothetical protein FQR65_LT10853 [Abscondita terminalis]